MKKNILLVIIVFCTIIMTLLLFYKFALNNKVLQFLKPHKVWIHRVNSIEKLNNISANYNGIEVDLVYIDSLNVLDVTHPPAKSIGISLEDYFKYYKKTTAKSTWLDIKNMNVENYSKILKRIQVLCNEYNINKETLVIESNYYDALIEFSNLGYKSSYYYHYPGLFSLNTENYNSEIQKIKKLLSSNNEILLSSNFKDYYLTKKQFPKRKMNLWFTGGYDKLNKIEVIIMIYKILYDPNVNVLLIPDTQVIGHR